MEYTITYGSGAQPAPGQKDKIRDLVWKGMVKRDTTFVLSYVLNETTHYLTTTVTVHNPVLKGAVFEGSIDALGGIYAVTEGTMVRIRDLRGPTGKHLTIDSPTDFLAGDDVTIAGKLTTNGTLETKGQIQADSGVTVAGQLTTNGTLEAKGQIQADSTVTIAGQLTTNGAIEARGEVRATAPGQFVRIRELRGPDGQALTINSVGTNFVSGYMVSVSGALAVGGKFVLTSGDGVQIECPNRGNALLSCTSDKGDSSWPSHSKGWSYWSTDLSGDRDINLRIYKR
ncbi:hypothetical protein E1283_19830 [Streptomyces hainanensis]|uniref:Uncharacterized protein n=1 Tax=Streptomyces hainanensis TaxID=402648 RepID=A0A4R4T7X6_9ACTN|nr:hypothetical protein E1283_19830 [Streptomyces hainanensis]